jgi:hypothetical protein
MGFVMVLVAMTVRVEKGEGLIPTDRINRLEKPRLSAASLTWEEWDSTRGNRLSDLLIL